MHARNTLWVGGFASWKEHGLSLNLDTWFGYLSLPFRFGRLGVMLFFVISGYCIHGGNVRLLARGDWGLRTFLRKRIRRIYPTLIGALAITWLVDSFAARHVPAADLGDNRLSTLLCNLLTLQNIVRPVFGTNGPLCSLSIEEHLYVLYPLLVASGLLVGRSRRLLLVVASISLPACVVATLFPSAPLDLLPYLFTWIVGAGLAEVEAGHVALPRLPYRWISLASGILAVSFSLRNWPVLSDVASTGMAGALVGWSIRPAGQQFWRRVPGSEQLRRLGVMSYSLYAIHLPVLIAFRAYFLQGNQSSRFGWVVVGCATCIATAFLFFALIERWTITSANLGRQVAEPGAA